ncbi:MAG: peptidoglycan DD-metalloendopeptidase family protein [Lagierella massiliensis]|nr:peptidoglycan DD-metalloendopeptidase family protein [Lagierella massiliensis]
MESKNYGKKLLTFSIAASITVTSCFCLVNKSFASSINEMETRKNKAIQSVDDLRNNINYLEYEKEQLNNEVIDIDSKIAELERQISELESQITQLEMDISKTEEEIKELEEKISENQKEFENRVSVMYMNSQVGYLDIVFSSENVEDLLSKASTMKFITQYDKDLINDLKDNKLLIDAKKDELNGKKTTLEITKASLDSKNAELYNSKAEKLALITEKAGEQEANLAEISKLQSEIEALEQSISKERQEQERREREARESLLRKQREEAARKANEAKSKVNYSNSKTEAPKNNYKDSYTSNLGSGILGWPVPGHRRISSGYGYRSISIHTGFHSGIDIPAGLGTPVVAAESGTVIFARYSGSYGNLMKVKHPSGIVTYYAHLSGFVAPVGSTVSKGQTIALMGSTGNSTGSHLHFEVRVNGAHTNPLNYVR